MKKLISITLVLVLLFTMTGFAAAAQSDATVPTDVKPVKSYTAVVGKTYRLPDDVKQSGDLYTTSNSAILAIEKDTGRFTSVASGTAYIVIINDTAKRYIKVTVEAATQAAGTTQTPQTWEEKINALTLNPFNPDEITEDFIKENYYNQYANLVKPDMTNYEILRAVYDHVVQNYRTNTLKGTNFPGAFQCTAYAHALCRGLYVVGFDVRYMTGECTVKGGGWTAHAWSAIKIGDEILYFDANIPGEHGGSADTYFAMVPGNTTFYRNIETKTYEVSADLGTWTVRS